MRTHIKKAISGLATSCATVALLTACGSTPSSQGPDAGTLSKVFPQATQPAVPQAAQTYGTWQVQGSDGTGYESVTFSAPANLDAENADKTIVSIAMKVECNLTQGDAEILPDGRFDGGVTISTLIGCNETENFPPPVPLEDVTNIAIDQDGNLWMATETGALKLTPVTQQN